MPPHIMKWRACMWVDPLEESLNTPLVEIEGLSVVFDGRLRAVNDVSFSVAEGETVGAQCHHHQSVREHPGFVATAWSPDEIVEAMEAPGDRFCVGVQWHPEMGRDQALFSALVAAAGARH